MRPWASNLAPLARRRGLSSMLVIAALIFGVVTMHAMSGSPMSHAPVPAIDSMAQMDATPAMASVGHGAMSASTELVGVQPSPVERDGAHGLMAAMCLMVLVALMVISPLRRQLRSWAAPLPSGREVPGRWAWATRSARPPSLIELGINRT